MALVDQLTEMVEVQHLRVLEVREMVLVMRGVLLHQQDLQGMDQVAAAVPERLVVLE